MENQTQTSQKCQLLTQLPSNFTTSINQDMNAPTSDHQPNKPDIDTKPTCTESGGTNPPSKPSRKMLPAKKPLLRSISAQSDRGWFARVLAAPNRTPSRSSCITPPLRKPISKCRSNPLDQEWSRYRLHNSNAMRRLVGYNILELVIKINKKWYNGQIIHISVGCNILKLVIWVNNPHCKYFIYKTTHVGVRLPRTAYSKAVSSFGYRKKRVCGEID